jgi:hypothetical protein
VKYTIRFLRPQLRKDKQLADLETKKNGIKHRKRNNERNFAVAKNQ